MCVLLTHPIAGAFGYYRLPNTPSKGCILLRKILYSYPTAETHEGISDKIKRPPEITQRFQTKAEFEEKALLRAKSEQNQNQEGGTATDPANMTLVNEKQQRATGDSLELQDVNNRRIQGAATVGAH